MRQSIQRRLLFTFIALAVVPLLIATLFNVAHQYREHRDSQLSQLEQLSERVALNAKQVLRSGEESLAEVLHYRQFHGLSIDEQRELLSELITTHQVIREVALRDAKGKERLRLSRVELAPEPIESGGMHELVQRVLSTGEVAYGDIRHDTVSGEPLLTVVMPVADLYSGRIEAVLQAELRLKPLWNLMADVVLPDDMTVYAVDEAGTVIAHRNPSVVLRGTRLEARGERDVIGLAGHRSLMAQRSLDLGTRVFHVVAEREWNSAMRAFFDHLMVVAGILLLALTAALAAGLYAFRRVARPIMNMEKTARAIAAGDIDRRVVVESEDEIGDLARSFNEMTDHLRRTLAEVRDEMRDREQAELALRESEGRFRQVTETIQEVFWLADSKEGRIIYVSPAFERVWGVALEELYFDQQIWIRSVVEEDRERAERSRAYGGGEGYDITYRILRPDGTTRVIHDRGFPVRNALGEVYRTAGVALDVTESVHAEGSLRATRAMLELVINTMPLRVFWKDRNARYLGCNRNFASDGGFSDPEEIIGKSDHDLVWCHQADPFREDDSQVMGGASKINYIEAQVVDGGEVRWWQSSKVPLKGESGEVVGMLGMSQEITAQKEAEAQVARSAAEWDHAMDFFDDAICLIDAERQVVRANRAFFDMVGGGEGGVVGAKLTELLYPEGEPEHCVVCRMQVEQRDGTVVLEVGHPSNPAGVPMEIAARVIRDRDGIPCGALMAMRDLSGRRHTDERLRQAAAVFDSAQEGVMITDAAGNIVAANPAFSEITGYEEVEVLGKNPRIFGSGRHDAVFFQSMWSSIQDNGGWSGEIWNCRKDGSKYPGWLNISVVKSEGGAVVNYVGALADVSKLKRAQEKLEFLAHHDSLTGLPNRLLLWARLRHAIQRAKRRGGNVALMFLDLDRFKHVNDSFGHTFGDLLLQSVGERLASLMRSEDTVARLGGDEFSIALEDIDDVGAAEVAEKLIGAVSKPFHVSGRETCLGVSIGISLFPRDGHNVEMLSRNADAAMYRAKEGGRNTYRFYNTEMTAHALDRVVLERQLRSAIELGQLMLNYQPQIDLKSGALIGIEALVRWNHPEHGAVPPDRFIPLAEETGLVIPLGEWVLRSACEQGRSWLDRGLDFGRISVNVAGPQIQRADLDGTVGRVLEETGLPAKSLELEVTESFFMGKSAKAVESLHRIRDMGVELAIDDFGTGYSSLSYLKRLPFNKLKIDRSFVSDLPHDDHGIAIARAVIALGHSMQYVVIAEGVENEAQQDFLAREGCEHAQGYLYARPMMPMDFERWALSRQQAS